MRILSVILLATFLFSACSNSPEKEVEKKISVLNYDQLEPRLNLKNDTTYVINFWATWCKPCVHELPDFNKVAAEYKNDKVKFLFVSLDFPKQLETQLEPFIKEHKITEEVVLLFDKKANVWINKISEDWTGSIPATLIYNKDFRNFREGAYSYNELKSIIQQNKF